ncbi:BadF/BadG/BcrA/BcrD ATPase family protein [Ruegeria faecimaris]|uniref:BadF/BadG/BcrA/BcrD ATPase family protein n=1 Tax=Ruegeria faecimaris TaxID=686389 RepID=UPI00232B8E8D|nr:BadF/BadG/BcrA/BcrD ATPase family protein [Ruegeria faecimaris]
MIESLHNAVLAVDGGGTRCRVACEVAGIAHSVEVGAANVSTDFQAGVSQIKLGLDQLSGKLGIGVEGLLASPAFVGLAGVTDQAISTRLRDALGLKHARIEDDRPAALRGALGAQDGLIAHCGTGSFLARQTGRDMRFAGGWGSVLGDEASAQWVGRMALSLALRAFDGTQTRSDLLTTLLSEHDGPAGIVRFAGAADPAQFGAIAPKVTMAAQDDDVVAQQIMRAGAAYLADTATHLGWSPGAALCLTGGIGGQYASYLPENMQSDLRAPLGEPLDGALALAKEVEHEHC